MNKTQAESALKGKLVGALSTATLCVMADRGQEGLNPTTDAPYPIASQACSYAYHNLIILHDKEEKSRNESQVSCKYFRTYI